MASLAPFTTSCTVVCPDCGDPIEFPIAATPGDWTGPRTVEMHVSLDQQPITAHMAQHQTEPTA